jgi:hypothetical protein
MPMTPKRVMNTLKIKQNAVNSTAEYELILRICLDKGFEHR